MMHRVSIPIPNGRSVLQGKIKPTQDHNPERQTQKLHLCAWHLVLGMVSLRSVLVSYLCIAVTKHQDQGKLQKKALNGGFQFQRVSP